MRNVLRLSAIAAILGWAGLAQAGVVCDAAYANNVMNNAGCEIGSVNNDSEAQVNADSMFAFSDWELAQKDDDLDGVDETVIDVGLSLVGDAVSGTWSIDDIWAMFESVMLVFKGGAGQSPDTYVGYLLVDGETSGTYATPFGGDISHVTVYVRGERDMSVPEPGTLALLGLGLAGLGFARRRKTA